MGYRSWIIPIKDNKKLIAALLMHESLEDVSGHVSYGIETFIEVNNKMFCIFGTDGSSVTEYFYEYGLNAFVLSSDLYFTSKFGLSIQDMKKGYKIKGERLIGVKELDNFFN